MSRHNKVNPDHYKIGGRLTADDLARERSKQNPQRVERPRTRRAAPPGAAKQALRPRGAIKKSGGTA
jgi:hypothetical protein